MLVGQYLPPPAVVIQAAYQNLWSSPHFVGLGLPAGGYWPHLVSTTGTAILAYNIATGHPIRTAEVLAQAPVEVEWVDYGAEADADFDLMRGRGQHAVYDIAAIGKDVGWRPRPLAQQMASYLAWARQNPRTFEGDLKL